MGEVCKETEHGFKIKKYRFRFAQGRSKTESGIVKLKEQR